MRGMSADVPADLDRTDPPASRPVRAEPAVAGDPLAMQDELARGWYNSSFELKRGLWVIETDLDPAVTHGIVVRKRGPRRAAP